MLYLATYDLHKPGQNYSQLYAAIRSTKDWWHYLDSTWLVNTSLSASQISEILLPHIDQNDSLLVIAVCNDYEGWLPREAWEWVRARM